MQIDTPPELSGDRLEIKYVPLAQAAAWDWKGNPKKHDIGALIQAFEAHGFKDPSKYEPALGGLGHGNGRMQALVAMEASDDYDPPRGILTDAEGLWYVPVAFGVDAASRQAAESYAIDHNNLTLSGGDFTGWDMARLWNEDYASMLEDLAKGGIHPVTVDGDMLDGLLMVDKPDSLPPPEEADPIDASTKDLCPSCGQPLP